MPHNFCTCFVTNCQNNPQNHKNGCDPCIEKNLRDGEVPVCFWLLVSDDVDDINDYKIADFVKFYLEHA